MRIAIVEWWPRLCGAVNWAVHLSGAQVPGTTIDLLTFSKSGKLLMPWRKVPGRWQVWKTADAVSVLNSYDLVILSDIVCRAPEVKPADGSEPYYVDVVRKLRVPWTTMIHDGSYSGKETNTMSALLATPAFSGALITTRFNEARARINEYSCRVAPPPTARVISQKGDQSVIDLAGTEPIKWVVDPYLPYDLSNFGTPNTTARTNDVLFLGRLSTNKGQDVLLDLFRDADWDALVYGYCAYGRPSHGWLLWEMATQHFGLREVSFPKSSKPQLKHPNAHKFYTGAFTLANRFNRELKYRGAFGPRFEGVDFAPWLALGLTNDGWKGTLEYATLDAIANGCVAVVPEQQVEYADYKHIVKIPYRRCSYKVQKDGTLRQATQDWDRELILGSLNTMLDIGCHGLEMISAAQRTELAEKHNPARILGLITGAIT